MSNQFLKLRRSAVPGKIPTTSSLEFGEIALNTYDGLAFMKKSGSAGEEIVTIGSTSGSFTGSLYGTASWALNVVNGTFPDILNTVTVGLSGSTGVDYNSIKTALDTITDASANKPYAVIVSPGVYIEDTMNVPQYVIVKGDSSTTTIVSASNPNNRVFNMSDQSMLIDMQVQGSTGTGVSAIYYSSSTTPQTFAISYVENVRFGTNYTNATCEGLNGANIIMQCSNVKYGGYTSGSKSFDVGFVVTGSNSGIGRMQLRNVTSTNGGITGSADQVFALANGSGCTFIVNGCLLTKSVGTARGTGFLAYNGSSLRLTAVNFQRWEKAIYMPNTGSAPSIFGSALNFENDTYDLLVEHPSASGKVDGLDTFLKSVIPVNAPLYEVNQDPKRITVAKKGGDFSSISASVAWITDSAETNRYVIEVGPGKFVENEIDLRGRPYVSIVGSNIQTTEIFPSSSNQHIVRMGVNNEISFLSLNGASPGYSAIYVDDIGDFAQAHKVSIYDSDTGITVNASTQDTQFYGEYIDINGTYTYGLYVSSSNTFSSFVNMENYYQFPVASSVIANYIIGPYSFLHVNSTLLESDGTTNTIGFQLEDGSSVEAESVDLENFDEGYYIPNVGLGPIVRVVGSMINDSISYDILNENPLSKFRFSGLAEPTKIINNSPDFYLNILGDNTGQSLITSVSASSVTASFLGDLIGTASWALNSLTASSAATASLATNALTASSADNFVIRQNLTGSNAVFTGTVTAQTLVVQTITSSVDFVTGSTRFGSLLTDTHQFTGSVSITGSLTVNGPLNATSSWARNALTASYVPSTAIIGDLSRIATGSVTASVGIGSASFQLTSGSSTFLFISSSGNVAIGTTTDAGFKLNVNGTARITPPANSVGLTISGYSVTGSNITRMLDLSGTWNTTGNVNGIFMNITNTASGTNSNLMNLQLGGTTIFRVAPLVGGITSGVLARDSFCLGTGIIGIYGVDGTNTLSSSSVAFSYSDANSGSGYGHYFFSQQYSNKNYTSGTGGMVSILRGFAPTSGTGVFNVLNLQNTINQTGGANGITRGLYVNPTLTAAAEWRSIEWSNNSGWGLYGAGTANNYIAGRLVLGSTTIGSANLSVRNNITGGTTWSQIASSGTIQSDVTSTANSYQAGPSVADSATVSNVNNYTAEGVSLGVGSSVTNYVGFRANNNTTATNNYGFFGNIALGSGRWNLYMNGTALNYLNGSLLVGTTTDSGFKLDVSGSARITNGLVVTGSSTINNLTGSLFGTASWALNAVTASYVPSSGVVGDFSRIATGSVTASVSVVGDLFTLNDSSNNYIRVSGSSNGYVNVFSLGNVNISASNNNSVILAALSNNGRVDISSYTHSRILNRNTTTGSFITNFGIVPSNGTIVGFTFDSRITGSSTRTVYRFNVQDSFPDNFTISYIGAAGGQRGGHVSLYGGVGSSNVGGNVYIAGGTGTSPGNVYLGTDYRDVTSSVDIRGNIIVGSAFDLGYKLYISGSGASGSLNVNNTLFVSGGVVLIESASLDYQQNLSVQTGSWQTIVASPTGSYKAAFFDYVLFSGSIGRAGIVTTFWSASATEFYENYTEDLGGSTAGVVLQTAISSSQIVLQATASSAAWTIRSLVRLL